MAGKRKLFVVINGKKATNEELRDAIMRLRDEGHDVQVRVTYESEDSERYVREALSAKDIDTIVAAGGDGSVNEIAQALISADAPEGTAFAVVPLGTANDFATGLHIPEDPWEALQLAAHNTASPIDIGVVNDQVFCNVATGGFGAEVTENTDTGLKDSLGGAAYILTGLTNPQTISAKDATAKMPLDAMVQRDDEWVPLADLEHPEIETATESGKEYALFKGKLLVLAVGNARQAGGGVQLCPQAQLDDGKLDVAYILNPSVEDIPKILFGLEDDKVLSGPLGRIRCEWLEVDCPDELQINRDGEPMRDSHFNFKVLPKRLAVHMPDSDLLSTPGENRSAPRTNYQRKVRSEAARPQRPKQYPFQHPMVKTVLKTSLICGIGIGLGMKIQQRRMGLLK